MNFIIDYLLKHAWPLGVIGLLLGVIGLYHISNTHKDNVIAGLKAQNVEQGIALMHAQSLAEKEEKLNKLNAKKADEYHALADAQVSEIKRAQVPADCEKAKEWVISSLVQ